MNARIVRAIVRKDLTVVARNKGVLIPLIVVPVVILVALPAMVAFVPSLVNMPGANLSDLDGMLEQMPAGLQQTLAGYDPLQQTTVLALVYLLAPMYLILPLMVAATIAADSFAGEKERKTLEALLYTPATDWELFAGKVLSALLAAVAVALLKQILCQFYEFMRICILREELRREVLYYLFDLKHWNYALVIDSDVGLPRLVGDAVFFYFVVECSRRKLKERRGVFLYPTGAV